jgi:hypothetical protein
VKNIVYCDKVQNGNHMHDRIVRATQHITNEMLANTWQETDYHLDISCH